MSTVQEVAFSFDYSSKKLQAFYQELDSDATTKENMDKRTKLRTLRNAMDELSRRTVHI